MHQDDNKDKHDNNNNGNHNGNDEDKNNGDNYPMAFGTTRHRARLIAPWGWSARGSGHHSSTCYYLGSVRLGAVLGGVLGAVLGGFLGGVLGAWKLEVETRPPRTCRICGSPVGSSFCDTSQLIFKFLDSQELTQQKKRVIRERPKSSRKFQGHPGNGRPVPTMILETMSSMTNDSMTQWFNEFDSTFFNDGSWILDLRSEPFGAD